MKLEAQLLESAYRKWKLICTIMQPYL